MRTRRREFKFRAWDSDSKKMWIPDFIYKNGEPGLKGPGKKQSTLYDCPLMQFTGLRDKNGNEIYEGDIVKNERNETGQIVFNNGAFVSQYLPPHNWDAMEPCDGLLDRQVVIGNIYENPELVKP